MTREEILEVLISRPDVAELIKEIIGLDEYNRGIVVGILCGNSKQ